MRQYLELIELVEANGTKKEPARQNMPGSKSYFGHQFRHNLSNGFPLLTTKKMYWKGVVVELLWFLRGDTNIKYLVDNNVNIWNQDAYNYYMKKCKQGGIEPMEFSDFIHYAGEKSPVIPEYRIGDCGNQYGKLWREWKNIEIKDIGDGFLMPQQKPIDQIRNVLKGLMTEPEGRRHLITALDPSNNDLALYPCHTMFQFNCRPLTLEERRTAYFQKGACASKQERISVEVLDSCEIPKYRLDGQLYQRSADVILGVPFNMASYSLLIHLFAEVCNMIPGDFVHSFGDAHIYDNHKEAAYENLSRTPTKLPTLKIDPSVRRKVLNSLGGELFRNLDPSDFKIENYSPQSKIEAELSTGMVKA